MRIPILIEEVKGIERFQEPLTVGIPFPQGQIRDEKVLRLFDKEKALPLQIKELKRWPDGSLKWALCDFRADCSPHSKKEYYLDQRPEIESPEPKGGGIIIRNYPDAMLIDTGSVEFSLDRKKMHSFLDAYLLQHHSSQLEPMIQDISVEKEGLLRSVIRVQGKFASSLIFDARLHFFAGKSTVRMEFTLRNTKRAKHEGGFWDLGDEGSIFMEGLVFQFGLQTEEKIKTFWNLQPEKNFKEEMSGKVDVNQSSSKGERVNPCLWITDGQKGIALAVEQFWQNFPIRFQSEQGTLKLCLLNGRENQPIELQAGEQKTFRWMMDFSADSKSVQQMSARQFPLLVRTQPEIYEQSRVFNYLTLYGKEKHSLYREMVDEGISGKRNFFQKREMANDYDWRNFGCIYADHEAVQHQGAEPFISHYNNQYDVLNGFLLQYVRGGSQNWFELARDLAHHTTDIDIYHTDKDKAAYNGGMFWHTEHYKPASTSTHRTYSKNNIGDRNPSQCGGGPGSEHNYTTGLLNYYFLTGDEQAKETVMGLADWVIAMDDGGRNAFRFLDSYATGLASRTASNTYHGPGRGSGNSLNALIDGYLLTENKKYLKKAEELIRRCVHPQEDIAKNQLNEPEIRWSYLVFLQALGKYLDLKMEQSENDFMFHYSRASLQHYAEWMDAHELPYSQQKEKVLIWTETWPAHDLRKSCVFDYAAKYSQDSWQSRFLKKGEYFYQKALEDLSQYSTRDFARPLAILMNYGVMHDDFAEHFKPVSAEVPIKTEFEFGRPRRFISQRERLKRKLGIGWIKHA